MPLSLCWSRSTFRLLCPHHLAQAAEVASGSTGGRKQRHHRFGTARGGAPMKVIKAIYDFIVGDMIILIGVIVTLVVVALMTNIGALASVRIAAGVVLIIGVLVVLVATLHHELPGQR